MGTRVSKRERERERLREAGKGNNNKVVGSLSAESGGVELRPDTICVAKRRRIFFFGIHSVVVFGGNRFISSFSVMPML